MVIKSTVLSNVGGRRSAPQLSNPQYVDRIDCNAASAELPLPWLQNLKRRTTLNEGRDVLQVVLHDGGVES
jgi:hypothetical protein